MEFSMLYQERAEIGELTDETADLIARARAGDREAFGVIFQNHSRFVYKFICAMLGGDNGAEELMQETFLAAYKSIQGLRGEATLRTWLCAIAKNLVYKSLRSRRREGLKSDVKIESVNVANKKAVLPDREFLSKELNQVIGSALAELDEDKRLVFTLKELQHLSYKEISEITGSGVPKLKTDLHRAKIEIRRILRPYLEAKR
jgi:RNA polymerase sigma-70 factor (ECF subfamily)